EIDLLSLHDALPISLSTRACFALPLVEKLSNETRGSIPAMLFAVIAEDTAISASCKASGSGFTAQSANIIMPLSPNSLSLRIIIKAPETTLMPGRVFTIWNAGRSTSPVAFSAPETSPSASPFLIIRGPRYRGSLTSLAACSIVRPLFYAVHTETGYKPQVFRGCLDQQF